MAKGATKISGTTHQQKLFAYEYFQNGGNATQAAIAAGYSPKSATAVASRLLTYAKVRALLAELTSKVEARAIISKERVIEEYVKIGLFDLRELYDENNALLPVNKLSDVAGAAIAGIEVFEEFEFIDKNRIHVGNTVKIKLNNKLSALDSIRDTMGWKAPTKIAPTDPEGNATPPLADTQVDKILDALKAR